MNIVVLIIVSIKTVIEVLVTLLLIMAIVVLGINSIINDNGSYTDCY